MNNHAIVSLVLVGLLISGCASPANATATTAVAVAEPSQTPATEKATDTATPQPTPTAEPTATVWPPVFDRKTFRDPRAALDSFVITIVEKSTFADGQVSELTTTIGSIKEPYAAYRVNEFDGGQTKIFNIDDRIYLQDSIGDWWITLGTSTEPWSKANLPAGIAGRLEEAKFVAEEDYQGTAAYHFIQEPIVSADTSYTLEGDFYLAKDSNLILYSHWRETTTDGRVYEATQTLTSINQLTELTLPADMEAMPAAVALPEELGLPLPPDSAFDEMYRSASGDTQTYFFKAPNMERDAFLEFYRNLPQTNGWTVTHVGHVTFHLKDCETSMECVLISNGTMQFVLAYFGPIRAQMDRQFRFSPAP